MFVLSYKGPNFTDVATVKVADDEVAQTYISTLPDASTGICAIKVQNVGDMAGMAWSLLGTLYNALAETPVKKFDSAEIARGRLFALMERVSKPWEPTDADHAAAALDQAQGADTSSTQDGANANSETETEEADMAAKKAAKKTKKPRAKKEAGERKPRKGAIPHDAKIEVLFEKNPRREGSALWKMYENLRSGMKVSTYLEKGGSMGSLVKGVKKKWIKIETN